MRLSRSTTKLIILYALILALAAFALEWLQYQYFLKSYPVEIYIVIIAVAFALLGLWVGNRLTARPPKDGFERNHAAQASLGITAREVEVLDAIAAGQSNKEIARALGISPNTVKTHIAHLFEKLQVKGRVRAIDAGRTLGLIR